jgi:hypothetical protein
MARHTVSVTVSRRGALRAATLYDLPGLRRLSRRNQYRARSGSLSGRQPEFPDHLSSERSLTCHPDPGPRNGSPATNSVVASGAHSVCVGQHAASVSTNTPPLLRNHFRRIAPALPSTLETASLLREPLTRWSCWVPSASAVPGRTHRLTRGATEILGPPALPIRSSRDGRQGPGQVLLLFDTC